MHNHWLLSLSVLFPPNSAQTPFKPYLNKPKVIWSLWKGYLTKQKPFWDASGAEIVQIHASGHADEQTLQRLVKVVKPGIIVPIHTQKPKLYEKVFAGQKIKTCHDGEEIEI
jgi:ribonuclease J